MAATTQRRAPIERNGGGRTGTFTLTEFTACDRFKPPEQRCGWYGDFVSDDGSVSRGRQELVGGLPKGAQAGETLRARDVGTPGQIYQLDDTESFGKAVEFLEGFTAIFVVGVLLARPWRFRAWLRSRSSRPANSSTSGEGKASSPEAEDVG
ncbi:hypothetical protein KZZ52_00455 [Dactylosporangium sp. AC04546]|uniref:hypothetical protein n=1 Tax=Dactylosporangium sp. AC04546 TaxID=2862460 RepID=UPI001EDDBFF3|nr:hypothetical protein [Dactylosporangium sp. AC04546]WVK83960.1 hypothetical protein KZZ52_00455 [Dactylosporangium sp. AC04546]